MKGLSAGDRLSVGLVARSREVVQLWSWAVEGKCNSFEFEFGFVLRLGALNHALPNAKPPTPRKLRQLIHNPGAQTTPTHPLQNVIPQPFTSATPLYSHFITRCHAN